VANDDIVARILLTGLLHELLRICLALFVIVVDGNFCSNSSGCSREHDDPNSCGGESCTRGRASGFSGDCSRGFSAGCFSGASGGFSCGY
jgi:hypothetical protein